VRAEAADGGGTNNANFSTPDALRFSFNEPLLEVEPAVTSIRYTPPPE
jgi:hypothetical protein